MWRFHHPQARAFLGMIPEIVWESDERKLADQINERYAHGGGWMPMDGWTFGPDATIQYPGDEPLTPVARYFHPPTGETLYVYPDAWVAIESLQGKPQISRMD